MIVSAATILENAVSELLETRLDAQQVATESVLERHLISANRREMNQSWKNRLKWLRIGFGVSLSSPGDVELNALIELRNAIAHDGKRFTDRQIANYHEFLATRAIVQDKLQVTVQGTAFVLTSRTGHAALGIARTAAVALLAEPVSTS